MLFHSELWYVLQRSAHPALHLVNEKRIISRTITQCTIYLLTYFLICMYATPMAILRKHCWCSGIYESMLHTENYLSMTCPQPLQWRHNERDCVSNQRRLDCLLNHLFRRRSKKTSNLRATVLCEGNPAVSGEFPAQWASNMEMLPFNDVIMITAISEKKWARGTRTKWYYT